MKFFKALTMTTLGLSLFIGQGALANEQQKEEKQEQQASSKSSDLKQVEGTVVQHKMVNVFKDKQAKEQAQKSGNAEQAAEKQMLVVMLQTAKGNDRLVVDLGQVKDVPRIKNGETKLQVEGKMTNIGTEEVFIAKQAKIDGNKLEIKRQG